MKPASKRSKSSCTSMATQKTFSTPSTLFYRFSEATKSRWCAWSIPPTAATETVGVFSYPTESNPTVYNSIKSFKITSKYLRKIFTLSEDLSEPDLQLILLQKLNAPNSYLSPLLTPFEKFLQSWWDVSDIWLKIISPMKKPFYNIWDNY